MRENMGLYRGKRKDNGEWVESHGISRGRPDEKTGYKYYLGSGSGAIVGTNEAGNIVRLEAREDCLYYEVDPDTVGQHIGKDKNGKKMFEGDIVKTASFVAVVGYSPAYAAFALEIWYKGEADDVLLFNDELVGDFEIIGNIHDNPELREV